MIRYSYFLILQSLNALSTEKQEMKEDYEKQLRELEDKWLRRQQAIMDENQKMIDHLKQLHQEEGLSAQKEAEALRATLKQVIIIIPIVIVRFFYNYTFCKISSTIL